MLLPSNSSSHHRYYSNTFAFFISSPPDSSEKMTTRTACFCKILLLSQFIYGLLEVCESNNVTSCMYKRPEVNPDLTLPATVTFTYTGVMTSQTACSLVCCSKDSTCAGFAYDKGSNTCLMAIEVISFILV